MEATLMKALILFLGSTFVACEASFKIHQIMGSNNPHSASNSNSDDNGATSNSNSDDNGATPASPLPCTNDDECTDANTECLVNPDPAQNSCVCRSCFKIDSDDAECVKLTSAELEGYTADNGKYVKQQEGWYMDFEDCENLCKADNSRVLTVKSAVDEDVVTYIENFGNHLFWMGLKETSVGNYKWADGTTMTVNLDDGSTDLPEGFQRWLDADQYNNDAIDKCFIYNRNANTGASFVWLEVLCDWKTQAGFGGRCICECNE